MNFAAALILLDLQRPAEARPHMDKAAAKLRRAEVQYVAGRLSAELSQWGEAAERFKAALEANPDHREARMYAAEALSRQGQLSSAEALLRDATRRDPGDARSWQVLGDFLVRTGRPNEARQVWTEGLSATGGDSTLASRLGANPEAPSSQE
jgi:predicted Zn-dependent protease